MAQWMNKNVRHGAVVVIKSDIENHDETVLSHLLVTGHLCRVSLIYGEHMTQAWQDAVRLILQKGGCPTELVFLDDESGDDSLPLLNVGLEP